MPPHRSRAQASGAALPGAGPRRTWPAAAGAGLPDLPGVLTGAEVLATGHSIADVQEPSGAIGWPDGHVDAWNHVECAMALSVCGLREPARRAYDWLRATQRPDGSWPRSTAAGGRVLDPAAESNQVAYVAVGVWHEFLLTGDTAFALGMWPVVRRAIDFVLALRRPRGEISWERTAGGVPGRYALLTGCSSIHQSLRCAVALAALAAEPRPEWEAAAQRLGHVVAHHPEVFSDKARFSMDWYYPVLAGPVRGAAARRRLAEGWPAFVVPGLGVRCVSDEPWVTGAETCELALTLEALGLQEQALRLLADVQHLRHADGAYWTGWQFRNRAHYPAERSTWTGAAVVLAADALADTTPGAGLFRAAGTSAPVPWPDHARSCGATPCPAGTVQQTPSTPRSSTRSDPSASTSVNAPDASARRKIR